ncbi:DNA polymerase subunit gamma-1, mitochondrial [Chelonus insularis]|uniref:DNA polymerase subunit gamma-1, mitochondrial n=1 Tax=Chelonus insularis TaxID=460826 RepID=UPI00158D0EC2|nr:DNA polymerase subunit gamma-1, mitochondrial [Chelonus insularis]
MRRKIKLINICIRHKCTKVLNTEKVSSQGSNSTKKIVRLKKQVRTDNKLNKLTSQSVSVEHVNKTLNAQTNKESIQLSGQENVFKNVNNINSWDAEKICQQFLIPVNNAHFKRIIKNGKHCIRNEDIHKKGFRVDTTAYDHFDTPKPSNVQKKDILECGNNNVNNVTNDVIDNKEARFNELNMQMLSKKLHEQVFINSHKKPNVTKNQIDSLKKDLEDFGMKINETVKIPDVDIDLPPLEGKDLEEHFFNVAKSQIKPYMKAIENNLKSIPKIPEKWILQEGWTRYTNDTIEKVDYPLEEALIFDVEVCVKEGPLPTLATAVSSSAWYGWVSKSLVDCSSIPIESRSFTLDMLIPLESTSNESGKKLNDYQKKPKIVVGHNVSYDRARIKEQYWLNSTGTRFVDTMSLHVSISGMNSYQRSLLLTNKENNDLEEQDWLKSTSLNNLADVYKLYCNKEHKKSMRDIFVEGTLIEIKQNFDDLINYCATDAKVTHEVFLHLLSLFQERFPHPVTFAGMLELSTAYLPVNSSWQRYIEESESTFEDLNYEAKISLSKRADEVCKLMHNDKYKEDLWMWDQDWSTQKIKVKNKVSKKILVESESQEKQLSDFEKYLTDGEDEPDPLEQEFSYLFNTRNRLPVKMPHMPGYPKWYRSLCMKENEENWIPGPQNISTSLKVTPKLLNLTWENYPLHYIREHGWGFLVPYNDDPNIKTSLPLRQLLMQCPLPLESKIDSDTNYDMDNLQSDVQIELTKTEFWRNKKRKKDERKPDFYKGSGIWCDVNIDNCCWFFKLPHKDGPKMNVGNPLAKDFLNKFSENVLAGLDSSATKVLKIAKMTSYWRNNRDRILSQLVIWLNDNSLPSVSRRRGNQRSYGAIIPQVVVSGTLTRRATEATWMTASNAHIERVGSELRAMVQAPPGFSIVGADVDSQELWIASLIGDAYCAGIHGATPFGWMTLIGNKSNGTDMHSVTAKAVGISRDHAKVINYARIYGAGQKFAERLLKQFNPSMTPFEALTKSRKMFNITKGKKVFRLKSEFISDDLLDLNYSGLEAHRIAKVFGKSVAEMFGSGHWIGGSESAMFNRLEEIAESTYPVTPFLNSRLSRALEVDEEHKDKYLPTKINWVVQSGAVDFLHLMLVTMRWLMKDNARFCLSFHDEIRYIVPSRYKYNAALAMHVTNLLTRSFCALRLGIADLPMSVAFFASVEVDTVLRKEATADCKTPSNPYGLENGYGISPGESLDIWKAIEKSGGLLGSWHSALMRKKKIEKTDMIENDTTNN